MLCRLTNEGLPSTLTQLKYLKAIGLKRNCLTSVPRMLGAMTSLQEIYLEDNAKLQVSPGGSQTSEASCWTSHIQKWSRQRV